MSILEAILQGIIQGATEFLPVSSSGHLSLAQHFMGTNVENLWFDVCLHLGTLVALIAVYHRVVLRLIREFFCLCSDLVTGKFQIRNMAEDRQLVCMLILGLLPLFCLFLPVPGTSFCVKDFASMWATDNDIIIEGAAFIMTAVLLAIGISRDENGATKRKRLASLDAFTIGAAQLGAALFPGLSRSGSTLSAGLIRGLNRQTALDYSFILGIPSILAAGVISYRDAMLSSVELAPEIMFSGAASAAIVGFFAIRLLRWVVGKEKLQYFAWYVFLLGVAVVVIGMMEHSAGINLVTGKALNFT